MGPWAAALVLGAACGPAPEGGADASEVPCAASAWYPDADGDGFGADDQPAREACEAPPGYAPSATDCDDGDPSDDLALSPGSPCVDAGDPATLDPDGSRADLGATGGPSAW